MFNDDVLTIIKEHENEIDLLQQKLFMTQAALNEAYQRQWAEMNQLIKNGLWTEKAVYKGDSYGLKVGREAYVFQLDAPLPFLPNTFYRSFEKTYKEFYTIKLMLTLQMSDVIEQIGDPPMSAPAALHIRHYYRDVRLFDLDNKSKQVVINTFRKAGLLRGDTIIRLAAYREDALCNEDEDGAPNRTMIYLYRHLDSQGFETEILPKYPRIDNLKGVISGEMSKMAVKRCPLSEDYMEQRLSKNPREESAEMEYRGFVDMENFM
ncbi:MULTISPECIES: hypothetical protein [Desulfitobacterium]|uniref:Uncharacterized protein n=1 Tax=Desulfitobacterium chlororespirans DSM 11544 TaxID=1121395 RepID=A0A1M7UTV8_9FIRM|nr:MULTISPECIES: hypothetical protein [Desulfitobacterium]SHN86375.1 hypothetical protein SAMN02745215_04611 [Desulfitobacterium chlororespirans DSM 11544]